MIFFFDFIFSKEIFGTTKTAKHDPNCSSWNVLQHRFSNFQKIYNLIELLAVESWTKICAPRPLILVLLHDVLFLNTQSTY